MASSDSENEIAFCW